MWLNKQEEIEEGELKDWAACKCKCSDNANNSIIPLRPCPRRLSPLGQKPVARSKEPSAISHPLAHSSLSGLLLLPNRVTSDWLILLLLHLQLHRLQPLSALPRIKKSLS